MAYFPEEIKIKSELQEATTRIPLSCDHVTTMNFGEPNVVYYRHNTPKETWQGDISVFARPMPMQQPLLGKAVHKLKTYYVPFRTISPQWNAFINKSPYIPANGTTPITIQEMPYFTTKDLEDLLLNPKIATVVTSSGDFTYQNNEYKLTPFGRFTLKILEQLGYKLIVDNKVQEHIDGMGLLAFAKVYMDFYYSNMYLDLTTQAIAVENLFKKDGANAYHISCTDIINIMTVCQKVFYEADFFTAQWDNPSSPNLLSSTGTITLNDISTAHAGIPETIISNLGNNNTPVITDSGETAAMRTPISQYAIDSLKKMTDYCVRFAMAGVREVDRYLARFGVLLAAEKLKRAVYYGSQETNMEFGAVYSTANTEGANVGDYAGSGTINSDHGEHKHFEIYSEEYGIILVIGTILPKIGYYQGIDRNNLHHEVETYFSGIFDQLGTQATAQAEVYVTENLDGPLGGAQILKGIYGYIPRGAEYKTPRDRLTGDFVRRSLNAVAGSWHLFRTFDDNFFLNDQGSIIHSPYFCQMWDSEQYLRIFDNTSEEDGDHFNVIYQISAEAQIHAKPLYNTYDFESEGKEIMLNSIGPKQN